VSSIGKRVIKQILQDHKKYESFLFSMILFLSMIVFSQSTLPASIATTQPVTHSKEIYLFNFLIALNSGLMQITLKILRVTFVEWSYNPTTISTSVTL